MTESGSLLIELFNLGNAFDVKHLQNIPEIIQKYHSKILAAA